MQDDIERQVEIIGDKAYELAALATAAAVLERRIAKTQQDASLHGLTVLAGQVAGGLRVIIKRLEHPSQSQPIRPSPPPIEKPKKSVIDGLFDEMLAELNGGK